jgi:glycosyltransferase involved in cell wall biosynthesis
MFRDARRATILDSSGHLLEGPNKFLILIFLILKPFLRFRIIKVFHVGSLPSSFAKFSPSKKLFFHISTRLIDEYITVNRELCYWLVNDIKIKTKPTVISSLLPPVEEPSSTDTPFPIEEELSSYSHLITSTGLFISNYGFKEIADAVESLRKSTKKNIGLILIEGTVQNDSTYREKVIKRRDWIKVYTDIPQAQVMSLLKASNLFVRATTKESYGLSKIESLWSGTPVLSTNQGEVRGMTIIDKSNPNQVLQRIEAALNNSEPEKLEYYSQIFKEEALNNLNSYLQLLNLPNE